MLDPIKRLAVVVPKMKKQKPDLMILLSYASREVSMAIAAAVPEFDVILTSGGPEDGSAAAKVGKNKKTLLLDVGRKGKHVGVLGFYPDSQKNRFRYELVELDGKRFGDDKTMHDLMVDYQNKLEEDAEIFFLKDTRYIANSDRKYVGVDQCKVCHADSYEKWKTTKHAHAYLSILKGSRPEQKKNWISRVHDPECLACHVTGWAADKILRFNSGFLPEKLAQQQQREELYTNLQGQQCENCHGPGDRHVKFERALEADLSNAGIQKSARKERGLMRRDVKLAEEHGTCLKCHDTDNSPNFNFDKYWEEIEH
ncbi:MAG: hypothetical protein IID45_04305 [Planctomycetes bacterium]|nr:hypothetical protein [Planctomycetota bacterium]